MVRLDAETWMKCGIEYVDGAPVGERGHHARALGLVGRALDPAPASLWIEVRRTAEAVQVSYGEREPDRLLRLGALTDAEELDVGVMAASPDGRGFEVALHDFAVEPCATTR